MADEQPETTRANDVSTFPVGVPRPPTPIHHVSPAAHPHSFINEMLHTFLRMQQQLHRPANLELINAVIWSMPPACLQMSWSPHAPHRMHACAETAYASEPNRNARCADKLNAL